MGHTWDSTKLLVARLRGFRGSSGRCTASPTEAVQRLGFICLCNGLLLRFASAHGGRGLGSTVTEVTIVELCESLNAVACETMLGQEINGILLTKHLFQLHAPAAYGLLYP